MADAYFVLSDKTRRSEYDMLAATSGTNTYTGGAGGFQDFAFKDFASMFGGTKAADDHEDLPRADTGRPDPEGVFANVFDDVSQVICIHVSDTILTNQIASSSRSG